MKNFLLILTLLLVGQLIAQEEKFKIPVDAEVINKLLSEIVDDDRTKMLRRAPTQYGQGVYFVINTDNAPTDKVRREVQDIKFALQSVWSESRLDTNVPVEFAREKDRRNQNRELAETVSNLTILKREDKMIFTIRTRDVYNRKTYQYTAIAGTDSGEWEIEDLNVREF